MQHDRHDPPGPPRPHFLTNLPHVELHIRRGRAAVRVRPVAGPVFLIGTATDCDLVLADLQFAEVHAWIVVTNQKVALRCVGDSPETTVNGRLTQATRLHNGDRVRTGPYEFQIRIQWPAPLRDEQRSAAEPQVAASSAEALDDVQGLLAGVQHWIDARHRGLRVVGPSTDAEPTPPPPVAAPFHRCGV